MNGTEDLLTKLQRSLDYESCHRLGKQIGVPPEIVDSLLKTERDRATATGKAFSRDAVRRAIMRAAS